jgi:hypothetical protein
MLKQNAFKLDNYGWVGAMELKKGLVRSEYRSGIVDVKNYAICETQRHDISQPFFMEGSLFHNYVIQNLGESVDQPNIESKGKIEDLIIRPDKISFKSVESSSSLVLPDVKVTKFNSLKVGDVWKTDREETAKLFYHGKNLRKVLGIVDGLLGAKDTWLPNYLTPVI